MSVTPTSSGVDNERLKTLQDKFAPDDIEWRIGQAGETKDGKVWATVLAYITNRAIMSRLDEVCGIGNWKNEFATGPGGGVLCGISIKVTGEWVTKYDGADNSQIEAVKGGLSDAMKRAGYQWGIGRYLYDLPNAFAAIAAEADKTARRGSYKKKDGTTVWFRWNPPFLPEWALPEQAKKATLSKELDQIAAKQ